MEFRTLGKDGPLLSTIGFGCWAMGGTAGRGGWGPQDDRVSTEAIHVALEYGINWFDTAAVYGLGHSEEVLGRALGSRRQEVIIATKCGLVWDAGGTVRNNGHYASILAEADISLRRLGTDYIDLYQMHWPDTSGQAPVDETIRAMEDLVRHGKVRYIGVSNFNVPLLREALAVRHIDSLQPPYNILQREVEAEILPFCQKQDIGVVAYSPLASGLLGGNYSEDTVFDPGDWRSRNPRFNGDEFRRTLGTVEQLKRIAARSDRTVAQLAIAWVLANPAVTSAIMGVRKPSHILDALPAAEWHLDAATMAEIEDVLESKPR